MSLATIQYHPMVEGISRKFVPRDVKSRARLVQLGGVGNSIQIPGTPFMGAQVRNQTRNGVGDLKQNVMFFRRALKARTSMSNDERMSRLAFAKVVEWVNAALKDLTVVQANAAKYQDARNNCTGTNAKKINGISAYGYSNQKAWMIGVIYPQVYNDGDFDGQVPQTHALPAFDA